MVGSAKYNQAIRQSVWEYEIGAALDCMVTEGLFEEAAFKSKSSDDKKLAR